MPMPVMHWASPTPTFFVRYLTNAGTAPQYISQVPDMSFEKKEKDYE